MSDGIHLG